MTIKWNPLRRMSKSDLLNTGLFAIFFGIAFYATDYFKPRIKNVQDLTFFEGTFSDYSWVKAGRGSSLTFRLVDYNDNFKIKADFFPILQQEKFKSIPAGQIIRIGIPKEFYKYLNTRKDPFFVYSISDTQNLYLDYNETIKKHNSYLTLVASLIFVLFGAALVYKWRNLKTKAIIHQQD